MELLNHSKQATFASGCFWCTEAIFKRLKGVTKVQPGYTGGTTPNPTYDQVCSGQTGHAESLQIEFDPQIISYENLLEVFFATHDPTTLNQQGHDLGTQYRSAIFYHNKNQKQAAQKMKQKLNRKYSPPHQQPIELHAQPENTTETSSLKQGTSGEVNQLVRSLGQANSLAGAQKATKYTNQTIAAESIADDRPQLVTKHIVTQIVPATTFYAAEKTHLNYYDRNQSAPYCQVIISPKIQKLLHEYSPQVKSEYKPHP